jgi:predicted class III extradiol MEMO1 family dioxygenase
MKTIEIMLQSWAEGRTRFTQLLPQIKHEDLKKKLANTKNTAGFLIRHISDVELLFAKNFFGAEVEIVPKTLIAQRDTGEWKILEDLLAYQLHAANVLEGVFQPIGS